MKKFYTPWLLISCLLPCCVYATGETETPSAAIVSEAAEPLPAWLLEIQQNKFKKPQQMLQLALAKEAESAKWSKPLQASYFNEIALIYEMLGRHRDQLATAEHALGLIPNAEDRTKIELLFSIGFALEMHREYGQANDYYEKGMALAKKIDDKKMQIHGLLNLSAMLQEDYQEQEALEMLKQAYDQAVALNDKEMLGAVKAELGLMYTGLGSDEEAQQLLQESYRIYDELGWEKAKISIWYNLASTYRYINKAEQALELFEQMLKVSLIDEDPVNLYFSYMGMATTSRQLKRADVAVSYLEKAEMYLPHLQSTFQLSVHHFEKALIYRSLGQTSLAMQEINLASEQLQSDKNVSDKFYRLHFEEFRARLYADSGEFDKAYSTLNRFFRDYVALQDDKRDLQVQKLRLGFDAERQQAKNELLKKDNELQALRLQDVERNRQVQRLWISIFAFTSLILFTLLVWQWKRRRRTTPTS
jgi:tetratricopeptide (TPR) repeat protein